MGLEEVTNEWGLTIYSTADGTRPVNAMGAAVTPVQNAYGSYVTLISGANLTDDCYQIEIFVNSIGVSTVARDCVVSIGLDAAGGTSFTSLVDLVVGPASTYSIGCVAFKFPLWIKSGTSIGAAASVNSATLTAINVFCRVKSRPSNPRAIYAGTYIDQFGVTLASSSGTAITPGTTGDGAWTAIGSAITRTIRYLEYGWGCNNSNMSTTAIDVDVGIGDGSNKKIVIANHGLITSNAESLRKPFAGEYGCGAINDQIYARAQDLSAITTGNSIAVYGIGG